MALIQPINVRDRFKERSSESLMAEHDNTNANVIVASMVCITAYERASMLQPSAADVQGQASGTDEAWLPGLESDHKRFGHITNIAAETALGNQKSQASSR